MRKKLEDRSTFIVALCGAMLLYATASADCATGGSCNFANGDFANWLIPKIQMAEHFFFQHLAGRFPFVG
jgi:hypothetical protein